MKLMNGANAESLYTFCLAPTISIYIFPSIMPNMVSYVYPQIVVWMCVANHFCILR